MAEERRRARGELARKLLDGKITKDAFAREWEHLHPPPPEEPAMAKDYLDLLDQYLNGQITAKEFQDAYWPMRRGWLDRDVWLTGEHGKVIDSFDTDVDAYTDDPEPSWHEIDETELRQQAEKAHSALLKYVQSVGEITS